MVSLRDRTKRARPSYLEEADIDSEEELAVETKDEVTNQDSVTPTETIPAHDSDDGDEDYYSEQVMVKAEMQPRKKRKSTNSQKVLKPKPKPEPKPFPLLELPAELRNMIYEYAMTDQKDGCKLDCFTRGASRVVKRVPPVNAPKHSRRGYYHSVYRFGPPFTAFAVGLLRANKQVHAEVLPILYGHQTFKFEVPGALEDFLQMIGLESRKMLQRIVLLGWINSKSDASENRSAFNWLVDSVSLKSLALDCQLGSYGIRVRDHQIYWAMAKFIQAYGKAHGRADAVLEILTFADSVFFLPWAFPHLEEKKEKTRSIFREHFRNTIEAESKFSNGIMHKD